MSQDMNISSRASGGSSISVRVMNEIARELNRDVVDLETPLYEYVDTDALEDLCSNSSGQLDFVEFRYEDRLVTIQSDGEIAVRSAESR